MIKYFLPFLFLIAIVFVNEPLSAQQSEELTAEEITDSDESGVIRRLRFTGNRNVSNSALTTLVRTRTNREFLGIRRFTPWYYIWQVFGVGESPSLLDREVVANDIERIKLYYENLGFFEVEVDTSIIEFRDNRYEVSFLVREGAQSSIRSVSYTGIPEFEQENLLRNFYRNSVFSGRMLNDSTFSYNSQYRAQELREEQTRIINFLKDQGYASVVRDSVRALLRRDDDTPTTLDVLFTVRPGDIYTFGDVNINLAGPEGGNNFDESETKEGPPFANEGYSIRMQKQDAAQTKFELLTEQIQFMPGDTFDQSAYLRTINSFQNLGNILINRFGLSEDSSLPDYSESVIPVYIDLQTIPKHSLRAEFFGMRRYGFGTGAGANYNNNNLFGMAENFSLGVNTSFEFVSSRVIGEIAPRDDTGRRTSSGAALFQSYEVRAEYSVPRLNFPFVFLSNSRFIESARTRYTLTYSQSNQLFFDINSDIRFNLRYEFRHSNRYTSLFDLIELDIVDTNPSAQFRENLINEFGEGSFEFLRIEQDFNPQFSSIIRYSFRSQNTHLIKRNFGHFAEFSLSFAGNIPYTIDRYISTPGEIEGSLPSPFGLSTNDLSYSRFIKFSSDYRRYIPVTQNSVFAFRAFGGIAQPIGDSETIPLNRRFFAGGSNDIRGWNPFRLGPGGISPDDLSIPGGEIKLALFKEYRTIFLRDVFNAQWFLAWHTDAGNVWYGPRNTFRDEDDVELLRDGKFFFDSFYKQIAVGSGLGLRLDWEFLVFRFDLTYRIHDIQEGWLNNRLPYFSFGIGHSF